jgi:hypothetical protein
MILALIILICIFSIVQSDFKNRKAACFLSMSALSLSIIADIIPGAIYFHICAICDLIVLLLIANIKTKLSLILSKSLMFSILINLFGFILWYNYQQPDLYVGAFVVYYSSILYILISRGKIEWTSLPERSHLSQLLYVPTRE